MQHQEPPRVGNRGYGGGERGHRRRRLRPMHHAGDGDERRVEAQGRPIDQRLPDALLAGDQRLRPLGAIAQEVGLGEGDDGTLQRRPVRDDAIDDGAGEPRQRERRHDDLLALGLPFRGDRRGQRFGRQLEHLAGRRAQGLGVEHDAMAAIDGGCRRPLVDPFHRQDRRPALASSRKVSWLRQASTPASASALAVPPWLQSLPANPSTPRPETRAVSGP